MVDIKNLNRVKGILSAKRGAEIPKLQHGYKFAKRSGNNLIYSADGTRWFMDESLLTPFYGRLDKFQDVSTRAMTPVEGSDTVVLGHSQQNTSSITIPKASSTTPQTAIPGDPKITPQTAIESAAVHNNKVQEKAAEVKINAQVPPEVISQQSSDEMPLQDPAKVQTEKKQLEDTFKQKELQEQKAVANQVTPTLNVISSLGAGFNAKQQATNSELTNTADAVYSAAATGLSSLGPAGQVMGAGMEALKTIGNVGKELTGGTDQMTKTDKWMDSAWLSWNIGLINSAGGKTTQNFSADADVLASVGSSYGGAVSDINDAASKAGKKYGKFSEDERKAADKAINEARKTQAKMASISSGATDQRLAVQSMGEQAGLAYQMMASGGYDQKYTYAAKHGGSLEWNPVIEVEWEPQIELNWELPTFKEGGNIDINEKLEQIPELKSGGSTYPQEYLDFIDDVAKHAPNLGNPNPDNYNLFRFWELTNKPTTFKQAVARGMFALQDDGFYHGNSVAFNQDTGEYEWIKGPGHGTRWMEKTFYDGYDFEVDEYGEPIFSEDQPLYDGVRPILKKKTGKDLKESEDFRAKYDLVEDENGNRKYVPKKFKDGGSIKDTDIPEIEETTQKNVIPEGALHKNKHHMEHAEGLTKKGIPVIDDEGDQQAEIEHSEIIFTLEVTKKLEEYYETFYSDESSNKEKEQAALDAGKLLVYQILENTEDRTGLIESCKKGGTLTLKKNTDDLIEEVLEWMPTIIIIEENEENNSKKDAKEKPEKEKMKEAIKEVLIELLTS